MIEVSILRRYLTSRPSGAVTTKRGMRFHGAAFDLAILHPALLLRSRRGRRVTLVLVQCTDDCAMARKILSFTTALASIVKLTILRTAISHESSQLATNVAYGKVLRAIREKEAEFPLG